MRSYLIFLSVLLSLTAAPARAELVWYWDDSFSAEQQQFLKRWLVETAAALERWAGPFPFDVHVHLRLREDAKEPVPWANTWRGGKQSLFFYVDPDYPAEDFYADWTAPHEFAHLLLPYLGRENAWAAEGFASYLQYPLMVELGVLDAGEAERRRSQRIDRAVRTLAKETRSLPENLSSLRKAGAYPTFYWAGAVFWERVDAELLGQGLSLQRTLREFLFCCRKRSYSLDELALRLDAVVDYLSSGEEARPEGALPGVPREHRGEHGPEAAENAQSRIFRSELKRMNREPGCPERPEPRKRPGPEGQATSEISTAAMRLPSSALR